MGLKTITVGIQGDAAAGVAGGAATGIAAKLKDLVWTERDQNEHTEAYRYSGVSVGGGVALGASVAPEIGLWTDKPSDLAGAFWGVELGAALSVGGEVGFYFNEKLDFLGFLVVPTVGAEVDIRVVGGVTAVKAIR